MTVEIYLYDRERKEGYRLAGFGGSGIDQEPLWLRFKQIIKESEKMFFPNCFNVSVKELQQLENVHKKYYAFTTIGGKSPFEEMAMNTMKWLKGLPNNTNVPVYIN